MGKPQHEQTESAFAQQSDIYMATLIGLNRAIYDLEAVARNLHDLQLHQQGLDEQIAFLRRLRTSTALRGEQDACEW